METNQYFRKFPLMTYRGVPAVNILKRVDFNSQVRGFYDAFYTHVADDGERIENIAYDFYGDVDLDWMIYHANDIIDPYFDVSLSEEDFENYIKKKYGSKQNAIETVYAYRNNYRSDPNVIDKTAYNALSANLKKYWEPALGNFGMVMGYVRKKDESYASTNMIISIEFATPQENLFEVGEKITATSGSLITTAFVTACTSTLLTLQHIEGDWNRSINFSVTGNVNNYTIELNHSTYKLLTNVIPITEQTYYSKYSVYDYESDINERKRELYLIDDAYSGLLNKQLDELMKK